MALFVREYDWMWTQLGLSLAECRVFAYIYGLTNKKSETGGKGYNGSKRQLATSLGLDAGGVKKILDTLEGRHLIVCTGGCWTSVESVNATVESVNTDIDSVNTNVESVNTPEPPINEINNMENKENNARANMRDANLSDLSFLDFITLFRKVVGPVPMNLIDSTKKLWYDASIAKEKALMAELNNPAGFRKPRPDWFISDFPEPQPTFLRGDEPDAEVQVLYNGKYLICSRQTMNDFNLEYIRDWN